MLFFVIILSFLGVVSSTNCHEVCDRDHNILDRGGDTLDCYFAGLVADGLYSCYLDWHSTKVDGDECHDEYTDFCCGASLADSTNDCLSNEGYVSYYKCYIECECVILLVGVVLKMVTSMIRKNPSRETRVVTFPPCPRWL